MQINYFILIMFQGLILCPPGTLSLISGKSYKINPWKWKSFHKIFGNHMFFANDWCLLEDFFMWFPCDFSVYFGLIFSVKFYQIFKWYIDSVKIVWLLSNFQCESSVIPVLQKQKTKISFFFFSEDFSFKFSNMQNNYFTRSKDWYCVLQDYYHHFEKSFIK